MRKSHTVIKIFMYVSLALLLTTVFAAILILEPAIKLRGWAELDPNRLVNFERTVVIKNSDGTEYDEPIYAANKIYVKTDSLNAYTADAFISIEDKRFYKHNGIDYIRVAGAALKNIKSRAFKEGASTISQQLIKNTHLTGEKTIKRKLSEMRLARALERKYSKEEILEIYLNILYFGNNVYGIGSAARTYFGKSASELTLKESAMLAGLINNPSRYNPCRHPEECLQRAGLVLDTMLKNGFIDERQFEQARSENPVILNNRTSGDSYPNGTLAEAARLLGCDSSELFRKNYTIETYCDAKLNAAVDKILSEAVSGVQCGSARAIVIENDSGRIISAAGYGNAAGRRQPGSVIKPILCYAPALEKHIISPVTPVLDEKTDFGGYSPSNYKDKYYGWISAADALKYSLNVPAVKLLDMNGIAYSKRIAGAAGCTFDKNDDSLAIALGGMTYGLTLEQAAGTYQCFANGGHFIRPRYVRSIISPDGKTVYADRTAGNTAVGKDTAYLITDMLRACAKDGTAKKLKSLQNVAAKTGTVGSDNGNTDAYCIAYSPMYTVAVWLGGESMPNTVSGGGVPALTARDIFYKLGDTTSFSVPDGVIALDIDLRELEDNHKVLLAGPDVPPRYKKSALFAADNTPRAYSTPQSPFWDYDDLLNFDIDNFDIFEGFIDETFRVGNTRLLGAGAVKRRARNGIFGKEYGTAILIRQN